MLPNNTKASSTEPYSKVENNVVQNAVCDCWRACNTVVMDWNLVCLPEILESGIFASSGNSV